MRIPKYTLYAKGTGVEIAPCQKKQPGKGEEGRIAFRFFRMESGSQQLRFLAEPWEGFQLSRSINRVYKDGGKETLSHKFDSGETETVTRLSIEAYQRDGRKGYAFSIQRGNDSINVSAAEGEFLFAAEFLKGLSVSQCWVDLPETAP